MIEALYRRLRTTKPEPGHKVYPYLLRGAAITRPIRWAMDITYIPMARGFVYLPVIVWATACWGGLTITICCRGPYGFGMKIDGRANRA